MINETVGLPELARIIQQGRINENAPEGLTNLTFFNDPNLGKLKIRSYDNEESAKFQEKLVLLLKNQVQFPRFLGRWNRSLVFQYLELENLDAEEDKQELLYQIGYFLAKINESDYSGVTPDELDNEVERWLTRFQHMRILTGKTSQKALKKYYSLRPSRLPVSLDYWDAMPHNFGLVSSRYVLLDEKHLRPSFPSVGLVKPSWFLSNGEFTIIKEGYLKSVSCDFYTDNKPFLEFYYLFVALYFYSLASSAKRIQPGRNPRFLDIHERLIQTVCDENPREILANKINFWITHPKDSLFLIKRSYRKNSTTRRLLVHT
jgi:hypothetical protein